MNTQIHLEPPLRSSPATPKPNRAAFPARTLAALAGLFALLLRVAYTAEQSLVRRSPVRFYKVF